MQLLPEFLSGNITKRLSILHSSDKSAKRIMLWKQRIDSNVAIKRQSQN